MTSEQKTLTIPLPELPPHIAKKWEIDTVRPAKKGENFLCATGQSVSVAEWDFGLGSPCFILRRREPEW